MAVVPEAVPGGAPGRVPAVGLVRGRERSAEIEALVDHGGGRVGMAGVLAGLTRSADVLDTRRTSAAYAFAWDREDQRSTRWWPQGITTSADADLSEEYAGRRLVLTTAYSTVVGGAHLGSRITVADVTEPWRVRYGHVLLVVPELDDGGRLRVRPLRVHAGGVVWHGPHLHVAATARGFYTCRVEDIVAAVTAPPLDLGAPDQGRLVAHQHRYLLPVRFVHAAHTEKGEEPFRYSFLSLEHKHRRLVAGEYGRGRMTTRLLGYDLEPDTGLPPAGGDGVARPAVTGQGVARMQGAVVVDGRHYVTTSAGRRGRGSVWTGLPGELVERRRVLPAGPEDLAHWPSTDRLWTVTEYPRRRVVLALDRGTLE